MGKKIDPKDLTPLPPGRIRVNGHAYYLEDDGTYSVVIFDEYEMNHPPRRSIVERETERRRLLGRMFLRRDRPWERVKY